MKVLVCGGGVIGASIAYCLSRRGAKVTVVERTGIACAASGKSGCFLALDWCDGTPLKQLARRSFALHARLPLEIGGDWGYRRMEAFSGTSRSVGVERLTSRDAHINWLSESVVINRRLGTAETTARLILTSSPDR